jgi:hypothetical protein
MGGQPDLFQPLASGRYQGVTDMAYVLDGTIGVDVTATVAGSGSSSDQGNQFALGKCVKMNDGTEYMYVHAAEAVSQYDWVGVDEDFEASKLTKGMVDDGYYIGIAQVAASDNDFFWIAIRGEVTGAVLGSCAADVPLYSSGTAGSVDDTSGSQTKIDGAVATAANGTSAASTTTILLTYPKSATF